MIYEDKEYQYVILLTSIDINLENDWWSTRDSFERKTQEKVWLHAYKHINDLIWGQFNGTWNIRVSPSLGKDKKYGERDYEHTSEGTKCVLVCERVH